MDIRSWRSLIMLCVLALPVSLLTLRTSQQCWRTIGKSQITSMKKLLRVGWFSESHFRYWNRLRLKYLKKNYFLIACFLCFAPKRNENWTSHQAGWPGFGIFRPPHSVLEFELRVAQIQNESKSSFERKKSNPFNPFQKFLLLHFLSHLYGFVWKDPQLLHWILLKRKSLKARCFVCYQVSISKISFVVLFVLQFLWLL